MATEAAWLNGEKERNTHVKSKTLLTGIGLLMEGVEAYGCPWTMLESGPITIYWDGTQ